MHDKLTSERKKDGGEADESKIPWSLAVLPILAAQFVGEEEEVVDRIGLGWVDRVQRNKANHESQRDGPGGAPEELDEGAMRPVPALGRRLLCRPSSTGMASGQRDWAPRGQAGTPMPGAAIVCDACPEWVGRGAEQRKSFGCSHSLGYFLSEAPASELYRCVMQKKNFGDPEAKCVWHAVFTVVSGLEGRKWHDRSWPGADEVTILREAAARGYRTREWCVRYA